MKQETKHLLAGLAFVLVPLALVALVIYKAFTADFGDADTWWVGLTASEQRGFIVFLALANLLFRSSK